MQKETEDMYLCVNNIACQVGLKNIRDRQLYVYFNNQIIFFYCHNINIFLSSQCQKIFEIVVFMYFFFCSFNFLNFRPHFRISISGNLNEIQIDNYFKILQYYN